MPKPRKSKAQCITDLLQRNIGEGVYRRDGDSVFCRVCIKRLGAVTKFTLELHIKTQQHKDLLRQKNKLQKQLEGDGYTISANDVGPLEKISQGQFMRDLVKTMVSCDIPLHKLQNASFKGIFNKYSQFNSPSESLARQSIIPELYDQTIELIKRKVKRKKIWISIDETRHSSGRFIAAVIIRPFSAIYSERPFLLYIEELPKTNSETILIAIDNANKLLGDAIDRGDVFMYMTDGAAYMQKSGRLWDFL